MLVSLEPGAPEVHSVLAPITRATSLSCMVNLLCLDVWPTPRAALIWLTRTNFSLRRSMGCFNSKHGCNPCLWFEITSALQVGDKVRPLRLPTQPAIFERTAMHSGPC